MARRILVFISVLLCFCAAILAFLPVSPAGMTVQIAQGASIRSVAKQLHAAGTVVPWWMLEATARFSQVTKQVKAGTYTLKDSHSTFGVWQALSDATPVMVNIKLLEGWTFKQMREAVDKTPNIKHDTLGLTDEALIAQIGANPVHPEGRFFPDTYSVALGSSDALIYKTAYLKMLQMSEKIWATKPMSSPLKSVDELINLAAIVEKETGLPSERSMVASVFHNRLKIGMRLQTDPTVIYGMGDSYKGRIRKVDLETDTPYNTYTRAGLPPTPIAAPSEASLLAAMNPADTPYFYFVAKGDGSGASYFSTTLTEHNQAVAKYLANRRETQ